MRFKASPLSTVNSTLIGFILPLISESNLLCFEPCSDALHDGLLAALDARISTPRLILDDISVPRNCLSVFLVDCTVEDTSDVLSEIDNLSWKHKIFIISSETRWDPVKVNAISAVFRFATVVFYIDDEIRVLSSPLDSPRFLVTTDDGDSPHLRPVESVTDLAGRVIRVVSHAHIYLKLRLEINPRLKDVEMSAFHQLAAYHNFTWDVFVPEWCGNATWTRCAFGGDLAQALEDEVASGRAQVDYAKCPLYEGDRCWKIRDFGPNGADMYRTWLVRRPTPLADHWQDLTELFSPVVWLWLLLSILFIALVQWLAAKRQCSLEEALLRTFQALLLTGDPPARSTAGLLSAQWSLAAIVLTAAFTADIFDLLTLPVFTPRVDTRQQLTDGGFKLLNLRTFFKEHTSIGGTYKEDMEEITRKVAEDDKFYVDALDHHKFVTPRLDGLAIGDELRKYRAMKLAEFHTLPTVSFLKGSPLQPVLSEGVQRNIEAGVVSRFVNNYKKSEPVALRLLKVEEDLPELHHPKPLTVSNLKPLYVIHAVAIALSVVLLGLEWLAFYFTKKERPAREIESSPFVN